MPFIVYASLEFRRDSKDKKLITFLKSNQLVKTKQTKDDLRQ